MAVWPTSMLALTSCWWVSRSEISPTFSTWVNCAVWARNCVESAGLLGSWYLSWATSNFRNVSLSPSDLLATVSGLLVLSDVDGLTLPMGEVMSVLLQPQSPGWAHVLRVRRTRNF